MRTAPTAAVTGEAIRRRTRAPGWALAAALCASAALTAGCWGPGPTDLQRELLLARETVKKQEDDLAARQATIDTLQKRLDTVRALSKEDLTKIFYPEKIEIDSAT